ncbi:vWA domain-containing protein [Streptomyces goshikiensis]|uniref:hypothetical protein n=1 Tax=Streptomyces goshikiensis TaxID=1942 RepID=UPI00368270C9
MTTSTTPRRTCKAWTDPEHRSWAQLSSLTGQRLAEVSGRRDLIAVVHPGAPESAYAEFEPAKAEARFAPENLLVDEPDPARIDPRDYTDRCLHPAFAGAICHEAAHAAYTRLEFSNGDDPAAVHWAIQLEEPRIEHRLIENRPGDRPWLRSSMKHVLGPALVSRDEEETPKGAVSSAVLVLGRAAGGVISEREAALLAAHVEKVIGVQAYEELREVFTELFLLADDDTAGMLALGARVAKIAQDDGSDYQSVKDALRAGAGGSASAEAPGQGGQNGQGSVAVAVVMPCGARSVGDPPADGSNAPGDGESGGAQAQPGTDAQDGGSDDADGAADGLAALIIASVTETAVNAAQRRVKVLVVKERDNSDQQQAKKAAATVFPSGGGTAARHVRVADKKPTEEQTRQARTLLRALAAAQYRDEDRTTLRVTAPPGRPVMRELVRRASQIHAGTDITAKPWTRTSRRQVQNPPLRVGISLDVSGSMDPWMNAVASTGWALAHAVASPRLAGTVAATVWNGAAAPLIAPGKRPEKVPTPVAGGGSSGCPQSLYALDGALDLTASEGARVVVVVTDGDLPNRDEIQKATTHLTRAGVKVLWLKVRENGWGPKGAHVEYLADPANFGPLVGRALAKALTSA